MSTRKKTVFERSFFYPIRRIGMESPAGCMESVAKRRHGMLRARPPLTRWHFVLCSVKDGTLAEQSALVRLQANLQTHFAWLSRVSVYLPSDWLHSTLRVDSIPQTSCGFHPRPSAWFYELHFCTMSTKKIRSHSRSVFFVIFSLFGLNRTELTWNVQWTTLFNIVFGLF